MQTSGIGCLDPRSTGSRDLGSAPARTLLQFLSADQLHSSFCTSRRTGAKADLGSHLYYLNPQWGERVDGEWWWYSFSSQLENPVRKILGKNSDWPGLISVAVPGPIRSLSQEKGRMAVKQAQIIGTKRLLSVVLNALQGPAGQEAPLCSLVFFGSD